MKRLINKIIIKLKKTKIKSRVKKANSFLKTDYYICRVCKQLLHEEDMDIKDASICRQCSKN